MSDTASLERAFYSAFVKDLLLSRERPSESRWFERKADLAGELRERDGSSTEQEPMAFVELDARGLTRETLMAASQGLTRPVVVRGFHQLGGPQGQWSREALVERLGDTPVQVYRQDRRSIVEGWDIKSAAESWAFSDFVQRMGSEALYLNNSVTPFARSPGLIDALGLERIRALGSPGAPGGGLVATNLFVSSSLPFTALHTAPAGNFFLQLEGRKRWTMLAPRYLPHLHALPGRPFLFVRSALGAVSRQAEAYTGRVSPARFLPHYEVTLEPGDLFFNSPWWWHEVENLDETVVGCAVRFLEAPFAPSPTFANQPLLSLLSAWPKGRLLMWLGALRERLGGAPEDLLPAMNDFMSRRLVSGLKR